MSERLLSPALKQEMWDVPRYRKLQSIASETHRRTNASMDQSSIPSEVSDVTGIEDVPILPNGPLKPYVEVSELPNARTQLFSLAISISYSFR